MRFVSYIVSIILISYLKIIVNIFVLHRKSRVHISNQSLPKNAVSPKHVRTYVCCESALIRRSERKNECFCKLQRTCVVSVHVQTSSIVCMLENFLLHMATRPLFATWRELMTSVHTVKCFLNIFHIFLLFLAQIWGL